MKHPMPGDGKLGASRLRDRWIARPGRSLASLAVTLVACSAPTHAKSETGSSSSASVNISVSVALQHRLRPAGSLSPPDGLKRAGSGRYCLETNGQAPLLPVMVIWPTSRDARNGPGSNGERVAEIAACGVPQTIAVAQDGGIASSAVIVRPE